ncbi:MAG: DUF2264 domain-containing protein [Firmicutes bacterium]|nr:DUF2264 domain-containing protein [Bacillota bacterium]
MNNYRKYWLGIMKKIIDPVLINLSQRKLKENMEVAGCSERIKFAYLEALGRTIAGISPWLNLAVGENGLDLKEKREIDKYASISRKAIKAATDPGSPDFMIFDHGGQPLVDTAFLAHGIIRAPRQLWHRLDEQGKNNLIKALKVSRKIKPCYNNWLLFSAMVETALCFMGEDFDLLRIDYALKEHQNWYFGDGIYGDGPEFHWDYYNSFVIQPMLFDIVKVISRKDKSYLLYQEAILKRAQRYAIILERLIAPDGSFPPLGRSLSYRFAAFQLLSQLALERKLPEGLAPSQVRSALTAVITKIINMPDTFNNHGWLNIGLAGYQPALAEEYITTGSLYLCTTVFLPLGLPEGDEFWSGKEQDWTSRRIWSGKNLKADQALEF